MDAHQVKVLQDTHDSTIRQEQVLLELNRRMVSGDKKFEAMDARFVAHDARLQAVELEAGNARASRRRMGKIVAAVVGALTIPAAAWAWEWVVNWLSGGHKP